MGCPRRAVAFQWISFIASPGTYSRSFSNSRPRPACRCRCRPGFRRMSSGATTLRSVPRSGYTRISECSATRLRAFHNPSGDGASIAPESITNVPRVCGFASSRVVADSPRAGRARRRSPASQPSVSSRTMPARTGETPALSLRMVTGMVPLRRRTKRTISGMLKVMPARLRWPSTASSAATNTNEPINNHAARAADGAVARAAAGTTSSPKMTSRSVRGAIIWERESPPVSAPELRPRSGLPVRTPAEAPADDRARESRAREYRRG